MADDFRDFVKFDGFAGQVWYHQMIRDKRILRRARESTPEREFTPELLFKSGEQGVWYDPSDLSTLFQDSAGTTPVTASEQPVGRMLDKSGRGNHASWPTASKRPLLQESGGLYSLKFDGVDDSLSTAAIDFRGTDKLSIWTGVTKLTDHMRLVAESSAGNSGSFYLASGNDAGYPRAYTSLSRGTASYNAGQIAGYAGVPAPDTAVLTITHDISGDLSTIKRNGVAGVNGTFNKGDGNFGNYPLYIASRAGTSLFFNGNIYSLVIAGALYDADTVAKINAWTAKKTGVTL